MQKMFGILLKSNIYVIYVQCDTVLLTGIFEYDREKFPHRQNLDPTHFYFTPDVTDMGMVLIIVSEIRDLNMPFSSLSPSWKQ